MPRTEYVYYGGAIAHAGDNNRIITGCITDMAGFKRDAALALFMDGQREDPDAAAKPEKKKARTATKLDGDGPQLMGGERRSTPRTAEMRAALEACLTEIRDKNIAWSDEYMSKDLSEYSTEFVMVYLMTINKSFQATDEQRRASSQAKTGTCYIGIAHAGIGPELAEANTASVRDCPNALKHGCGRWDFVMGIHLPREFSDSYDPLLIRDAWFPSHGIGPYIQRGLEISGLMAMRTSVGEKYRALAADMLRPKNTK